jgi:hypothetical protein
MPLPDFNAAGDLPPGIHRATMEEVMARFGGATRARWRCIQNLRHIYGLAESTGDLERFIVFGSFVSNKAEPNDIDVIMLMSDTFQPNRAPIQARGLFDHAVAQARFGASVFWITRSITLGEPVEEFMAHWQSKRDGTLRGIVEVVR